MMTLLIFGPRLGRIFGNDDDDGDGSTSDDADVNSHANASNFADANPTEGVCCFSFRISFPWPLGLPTSDDAAALVDAIASQSARRRVYVLLGRHLVLLLLPKQQRCLLLAFARSMRVMQ